MSTERDTHFAGFAQLLADDLAALNGHRWNTLDEYIAAKRELIAQRTYDLVLSIHRHDWLCHNPEETIKRDPDLTAWPE